MILRRKALFYTVNLVIPCVLFAILTTFVFYIPLREHKITFSISVLVTLTVFYLVLIDLIPPTSLVIPLIGKYLLFTMLLVTSSIMVSVVILNIFRRDASTHRMPPWMKTIFLGSLPKLLCIKPPEDDALISDDTSSTSGKFFV
uniref:Neurotransmitter-gated ion-channel transmembrane domain-containing protein n=2 Tax=Panagrolaimus sp. JU765 TaxID=591449 RepID=A0AC34QYB2_9BILA